MVFLRFYLKGCMLTKTYPGGILTYILKYNLEESMFYRFPAMRGIQANSEYFVCMIPLGVLANYAAKLFTLSVFYDVNKRIIKNPVNIEEESRFLIDFWTTIVANMRDWNDMDKGELSKKELREAYISLRGITLHAFGKLGAYFFSHPQYDLHKCLTGLSKIDWSRSNLECWENRAITDKGRINRNEKGIFLTYIQIKRLLNLEIDSEEAAREKQLL